jgi:hypothetical protein
MPTQVFRIVLTNNHYRWYDSRLGFTLSSTLREAPRSNRGKTPFGFFFLNLAVQKKKIGLGKCRVEKFYWCRIFDMVYKRGITDSWRSYPRTQTQKSRTPNQHRTLQTNVKK